MTTTPQPITQTSFSIVPLPSTIDGSFLHEWVNESTDPWIKHFIQQRIPSSTSNHPLWDVAICVGLITRLEELSSQRKREIIQQVLQGKRDPQILRPFRWIQSISLSHRQYLQDRMFSRMDWLQHTFEELQSVLESPQEDLSDTSSTESYFSELLIDACIQRDDLECLHVLLHSSDDLTPAIQDTLHTIDQQGQQLIQQLLSIPNVDYERLNRTCKRYPAAWWCQPSTLATQSLQYALTTPQ